MTTHRGLALLALLTAEAMNLMDTTIVQVAGPTIADGLRSEPAVVPWFGAAYTLPFAVLLISGGRLGDAYGRRRVFTVGVVGFTLASLACAGAPTVTVLLAARAVQGAAAAAIVPQTFGLIRAMFTGDDLARALGSIGPVMGLASIVGPVLGAFVTHADLAGTSWRAAFLINVPLAVLVLAGVPAMREDRADVRPRLDLVGTALAVTGIGLITVPVGPWELVAVGVLSLGGFVARQRRNTRRGRPTLVEPGLFRERTFPAALAACGLFFAVTTGTSLVVVLYEQLALGRDVLAAGLTLVPWSAGSAVGSLVAGLVLVPRYGPKVVLAGPALLAAGLAGVLVTGPTVAALGVAGVGIGLFTVPLFTAALARIAPAETGSAAGLLNAVQQLGATIGVAALGAMAVRTSSLGPAVTTALVLTGLAALAALGVASTAQARDNAAKGMRGGV